MLFDYIDTKDIIKSNISYLSPGNAPYYWIIIAIEVLLIKSAHELSTKSWYVIFVPSALVIVLCVAQALRELCDTDEITQRNQVRTTRVLGIVVPLLSLVMNISRLKLDPSFFSMAVTITFVQVLMFIFFVKDKKLKKGKSLNIPQMLVICSSLLFMTHATMASLSARHIFNVSTP